MGENPKGRLDRHSGACCQMYTEIFSGLNERPEEYLDVYFNEDHEEMVLVKDIPFIQFVSIIFYLSWDMLM